MEKSTISKCGEHNSNGFNHMNFDWLVELIMVDNGNTNNNGWIVEYFLYPLVN